MYRVPPFPGSWGTKHHWSFWFLFVPSTTGVSGAWGTEPHWSFWFLGTEHHWNFWFLGYRAPLEFLVPGVPSTTGVPGSWGTEHHWSFWFLGYRAPLEFQVPGVPSTSGVSGSWVPSTTGVSGSWGTEHYWFLVPVVHTLGTALPGSSCVGTIYPGHRTVHAGSGSNICSFYAGPCSNLY